MVHLSNPNHVRLPHDSMHGDSVCGHGKTMLCRWSGNQPSMGGQTWLLSRRISRRWYISGMGRINKIKRLWIIRTKTMQRNTPIHGSIGITVRVRHKPHTLTILPKTPSKTLTQHPLPKTGKFKNLFKSMAVSGIGTIYDHFRTNLAPTVLRNHVIYGFC